MIQQFGYGIGIESANPYFVGYVIRTYDSGVLSNNGRIYILAISGKISRGTDDLSIRHSWAIPSLLSGDGNTMSEPHVCQQHWAVIWKHSMEACLYS